MPGHSKKHEFPALRVRQWLSTWDDVVFDPTSHRRRPPDHFFIFSMPARQLRLLSGIQRRTTRDRRSRSTDLGIQRRHNVARSAEIGEFVKYGFPWSSLSESHRKSKEYEDLIKPGWLPTAVVVNILVAEDDREGDSVAAGDLVSVKDEESGLAKITVPFDRDNNNWQPAQLPPIEVIDGQHRLWAFEQTVGLAGDFELPVVAFHGLDISWQAYLFYVINIKPVKINTSLAFDLYPLLRTEDWLEHVEGPSVYRESRAQELTEALWAYPTSPWHGRIDMLGESGRKYVTQAAWIRSLMATFIKSWEGRRVQVGGLFGAPAGQRRAVLPWTRAQQAAFLVHLWRELERAIRESREPWAETLREAEPTEAIGGDAAFIGSHTLPNTDQGVRAVMAVVNDLCWVKSDTLDLRSWPAGDFI